MTGDIDTADARPAGHRPHLQGVHRPLLPSDRGLLEAYWGDMCRGACSSSAFAVPDMTPPQPSPTDLLKIEGVPVPHRGLLTVGPAGHAEWSRSHVVAWYRRVSPDRPWISGSGHRVIRAPAMWAAGRRFGHTLAPWGARVRRGSACGRPRPECVRPSSPRPPPPTSRRPGPAVSRCTATASDPRPRRAALHALRRPPESASPAARRAVSASAPRHHSSLPALADAAAWLRPHHGAGPPRRDHCEAERVAGRAGAPCTPG